jgi:hypothetical protein
MPYNVSTPFLCAWYGSFGIYQDNSSSHKINSGFVLNTGDQVLEWNGVPLTGKTFEDVQKLVSQTEGEVEIVVKR